MSRDTLLLLRGLLIQQTLAVGATDFKETVTTVMTALDEIDAELATAAPTAAPAPTPVQE